MLTIGCDSRRALLPALLLALLVSVAGGAFRTAWASTVEIKVQRASRTQARQIRDWCVYEVTDLVGTPSPCPIRSRTRVICVACPPDTGDCAKDVHIRFFTRDGVELCDAYAQLRRNCDRCPVPGRLRFVKR